MREIRGSIAAAFLRPTDESLKMLTPEEGGCTLDNLGLDEPTANVSSSFIRRKYADKKKIALHEGENFRLAES